MRSKSELIIANLLFARKIPYQYEYPVRLKGFGTVHPDFTVLNVRLRREYLWEHRGMMDDAEYAESALRKEKAYFLNGFYAGDNLILTSETQNSRMNITEIKTLIHHYFL